MTSVVAGARDRTQDTGPDRRTAPAHDAGDLCIAKPDSMSERVGHRLSGLPWPIAGGLAGAAMFLPLLALVVGLGFLLTEVVLPGAVQRWDLSVVRDLASGRPEWNDPSVVGSYFGETVTVIGVVLVVAAICCWRKWFALAALFVIAIALEGFFYLTTTYFVERNRPHLPRLEDLINSDSYYSGHVAASVVVWIVLALIVWNVTHNRLLRGIALVLAVAAPVMVALARMYRGMHHPTDAIVGYLVGLACIAIALFTVRVANAARMKRLSDRASVS